MPQRQGNDLSIENERASQSGTQAEVQHAASFITAQRLHAGVIHDSERTRKGIAPVKLDPTGTKIVRFGAGVAVANVAWIAQRDALVAPILRIRFDAIDQPQGREPLARSKSFAIAFPGFPDLHVRPANVNHEDIHGSPLTGRGNATN